jgi:hypothetical protein
MSSAAGWRFSRTRNLLTHRCEKTVLKFGSMSPAITTREVADRLVQLCRQGKFTEATEALYSPDIVSVEAAAPPGGSREVRGIDAVRKKGEGFNASHEVHSCTVEGPLVAGSCFSVLFRLDMTFKPEKKRFTMEEIAVYKVANGKVVHEEFFYDM